jgi:hypothetical protein
MRLPFRPGRGDLVDGAELEPEQDVADDLACGVTATRDSAGSQARPTRSSSISLASGRTWLGGRPWANAAVVMARMTSTSRSVSRRISTRSRWPPPTRDATGFRRDPERSGGLAISSGSSTRRLSTWPPNRRWPGYHRAECPRRPAGAVKLGPGDDRQPAWRPTHYARQVRAGAQ